MPGPGKRLIKVAELYATLEQSRLVDLQRTSLSVAEVDRAIALQEQQRRNSRSVARAALEGDDRTAWLLAESRSAIAGWSIQRLETLSYERHSRHDAAMDAYQISRIQSEQINRILENSRDQAAIIDGRRVQAAADDRYLSGSQWIKMQKSKSAQDSG